jgi:hypothetical protein
MEHMLRLFYQDITDEQLPTPEGSITYKFVPGAEKPVESNPINQLELLTNEFNLNPRPVLILLVEGNSEARVIPEIIENVFSTSAQKLGIQIISLTGIGNFDGTKKYDPQGALVRLVDDYHTRGTIVYIILDNEGRAKSTKNKLINACSIYQARMVTREEYVVIWDKNIEFDNFTDVEIARAMTELMDNGIAVEPGQVGAARNAFGSPYKVKLDDVIKTISCRSLDKPLLLSKLANRLSIDPLESDEHCSRPIIAVVKKVINLAYKNRPQSSQWHRDYLVNQGLYGKLLNNSPPNFENNEGGDDIK